MEKYILFSIIGYLSGSILYAYWIPKLFCNVDVCSMSDDGNPGTANAFKYGGIYAGISVLIMELLKGAVPVYISLKYLSVQRFAYALVMASPVLGHAFPPYRSKGGKSIAVSFGVLLGFYPDLRPALFLAMFYIIFSVLLVIQPHFYRSIVTFALFCICVLLLAGRSAFTLGCVLLSVVVIYKHYAMANGEQFHMEPFWKALNRRI